MDNKDKARAIQNWQRSGQFHPLTCGNDSSHSPLIPQEVDGEVKLRCVDCDYVQDFVPGCVFDFYNDTKSKESDECTEQS